MKKIKINNLDLKNEKIYLLEINKNYIEEYFNMFRNNN